jgi:glucoamylase
VFEVSQRAGGGRLVLLSILAALGVAGSAIPALAKPPAPGAPGAVHTWAPADKHGFGTSHQLASKAYFTLRAASLTEVYFPDLSTPSFRGLQFAVTDGETFLDRETVDDDPRHIEAVTPGVTASVEAVAGSLAYRQVTETTRWRLTKTWITDPQRPTVLGQIRFESLTGEPLQLYALADPALGNDGDDDRGTSGANQLVAFDDAGATVIATESGLEATSSGYRGSESDPWEDLEADRSLSEYDATEAGNVVQGARVPITGQPGNQSTTLAIGFGQNAGGAAAAAEGSLLAGFAAAETSFTAGWAQYLSSLKDPPASVAGDPGLRRLYEQSLLVLAASEDKTYRGASIAAPNMAWIWGTLKLEEARPGGRLSGPYHLVWPRDLYHVATAQKAAGDDAAAGRLLDYLWSVQKPDGSFWQNTRVDGTPKWTTEQLDQTALPVVLAWWLGRTGAADWAHVEQAADYIAANGPTSDNERWENQGGFSPNTIATEIAGLVCAADIARANGAPRKARGYEKLADSWQELVENWTATHNGPYSPKPYYLRVTKDGKPNQGTTYNLGDNFDRPVDQREIVDNSFLGLVLFGVKPWDDQFVRNSLQVGDSTSAYPLAVSTPSGTVWHRFTFDGYGEQPDGGDWDLFFDNPARQTRGRLWPLLSGERGEYELAAGNNAGPFLQTIANTANDGLMLPEQVWDDQPPPGEIPGRGTRSATPLAWTHGQFVRLAWSIDASKPIERPAIVACRYTGVDCETGVRPAATPAPSASGLAAGACANPQNGTDRDEVLTGTDAGDRINGLGGTDIIHGLPGDDCLSGGSDLDKLIADAGRDRLAGGSGDDILAGGDDNDLSSGGAGADRMTGDAGNDRVAGNAAADRLTGSAGRDRMSGGTGRDRMSGGAGRDRMSGGAGRDRMLGGAGNDRMAANGGRNRLSGGRGNDRINSVNGRRDTVKCGRGRRDRARVDRSDRTRGCERVIRRG